MKQIEVNGDRFLAGKINCVSCERKFKFTLPLEAFYWWSRLCSKCEPTLGPRPKLKPGEFYYRFEEMPNWVED